MNRKSSRLDEDRAGNYLLPMRSGEKVAIGDQEILRRLREKEESRMRDLQRLARDEISPETLQSENSIFTREWISSIEIPDYFRNVGVS